MEMNHSQRAQILIEALPYIQKYYNKIVVINIGCIQQPENSQK